MYYLLGIQENQNTPTHAKDVLWAKIHTKNNPPKNIVLPKSLILVNHKKTKSCEQKRHIKLKTRKIDPDVVNVEYYLN